MTPTLGQRLQQAREHRGLSLPDVAHQTRIPVHRLRELEEDNYNSLGSVTYAKGHLRAYAELLGIEAGDVLEQMKAPPLGGVRNYRYLVENHGPLRAVSQTEHPQDRTTVASSKSPIVTATVSAFFVMLVGGVLLANAFLGEQQKEATPTAVASEAVAAPFPADDSSYAKDGDFTLYGADLEVEPEVEVRTATPVVNPPKALPVSDEEPATRRKISGVPKAQLVE